MRFPSLTTSTRRSLVTMILALLLLLSMLPSSVAAETNSVYFDNTGQVLAGAFYEGWENITSLQEAGAPISGAVNSDGRWLQWFENARLEVDTSDLTAATAEQVQFSSIGMELAQSMGLSRWHPAFQPRVTPAPDGAQTFANGHSLSNAFLETWTDTDGATWLGDPISEEFSLGEKTYQFFQRGALSWAPNLGVLPVGLGYLDAAMNRTLQLGAERPEGVPTYGSTVAQAPAHSGGRWIDVNLSSYVLTAYEGSEVVATSYLVSGAPATPTATGEFNIYWKLPSQTMEGDNLDGTRYRTEDVPWVMYFYADFAIHGAYWRSGFGYSASHGCVNLPVPFAEFLYGWAPVGTRVSVHY